MLRGKQASPSFRECGFLTGVNSDSDNNSAPHTTPATTTTAAEVSHTLFLESTLKSFTKHTMIFARNLSLFLVFLSGVSAESLRTAEELTSNVEGCPHMKLFKAWSSTHGKEYESEEHLKERMRVWVENNSKLSLGGGCSMLQVSPQVTEFISPVSVALTDSDHSWMTHFRTGTNSTCICHGCELTRQLFFFRLFDDDFNDNFTSSTITTYLYYNVTQSVLRNTTPKSHSLCICWDTMNSPT